MEESNRDLLIVESVKLGVELDEGMVDKIVSYLILLDKWSARMNLTGVKGERERIIELILDSMVLAPIMEVIIKGQENPRVMDFGSGAGIPGIPLAIVMESVSFDLVDSRRKRCTFMDEAIRRLGLLNARAINSRVEGLGGEYIEAFTIMISKAVGDASYIFAKGGKYLKEGGRMALLKGINERTEEIHGLEMESEKEYDIPGKKAGRKIVVYRKVFT